VDKLGPTLIIVAIIIVVFGAMWWGWRRRSNRDAALRPTQTVPADLGAVRAELDAFYVATTEHGAPLERLAIRGLSFRGRARLTIADAGMIIAVTGEKDVFIPAPEISSFGTANVTIDRVVESGGLVRLAWRIGTAAGTGSGELVDSYIRVVDPGDRATLLSAVHSIAPAASDADNPTSSENSSDDTESEV